MTIWTLSLHAFQTLGFEFRVHVVKSLDLFALVFLPGHLCTSLSSLCCKFITGIAPGTLSSDVLSVCQSDFINCSWCNSLFEWCHNNQTTLLSTHIQQTHTHTHVGFSCFMGTDSPQMEWTCTNCIFYPLNLPITEINNTFLPFQNIKKDRLCI